MSFKMCVIYYCIIQIMVHSAICYDDLKLNNGWVPISKDRVYAVRNLFQTGLGYNDLLKYEYSGREVFKIVEPQAINDMAKNYQIYPDTDNMEIDQTTIINKVESKKSSTHSINIFSNKKSTESHNLRKAKKIFSAENTGHFKDATKKIGSDNEINKLNNVIENHYEVTENTELVELGDGNDNLDRTSYIHTTPILIRPKQSFSNKFLEIFSKYNISDKDNLSNYALSRIPKSRQVFVDDQFLRVLNKGVVIPRHLYTLLFPKRELFLPNYRMFRTLASNYPYNNVSGPYKVYFDTDSSN